MGSGALTCSLLRAVGDGGYVHSFERRADFAEVARGNVEMFFGDDHPAWQLTVGDLQHELHDTGSTASSPTCWPRGSASPQSRPRWFPAGVVRLRGDHHPDVPPRGDPAHGRPVDPNPRRRRRC